MSFDRKLDNTLNEVFGGFFKKLFGGGRKKAPGYINPDMILSQAWSDSKLDKLKVRAFIYNPDGVMHYADKSGDTHYNIIHKYYEYYGYEQQDDYDYVEDWIKPRRKQLLDEALIGRVGDYYEPWDKKKRHIVAFWNDKQELYNQMLRGCLDQLEKDNWIDDSTLISTPVRGIVQKRETERQIKTPEDPPKNVVDPIELELQQKMHTMPGPDKRSVMKYLGIPTHSKKNEWQKEAEKAGIVQPGQKWWAMTSDDIDRRLDAIEESLDEEIGIS